MELKLVGLLAAIGGIFSIFCAAKDYDWFMEHRKAWLFVKLFGRDGARVFYVLFGAGLIALGVYIAFFVGGPQP